MNIELVTASEPRQVLRLDEAKVAAVGAARAAELLRARVLASGHTRTGELANSYGVDVARDGSATVGPLGERNQIAVKVLLARHGVDLVTLLPGEREAVRVAMAAELRRQVESGEARIE